MWWNFLNSLDKLIVWLVIFFSISFILIVGIVTIIKWIF